MAREEARAAVGSELTPTLLGELLAELAEAGEIAVEGERFRVGGGEVVFDGAAGRERERLTALYRAAGCGPQLHHEILQGAPDPHLAEEVIAALLDLGELVKITPDLHVHAEALGNAIAALGRIAERDGAISVKALKDELGISRKYAVPLFEYFDANKITRREADVRILLSR
jgi:selenocysteine-specific elongation factor